MRERKEKLIYRFKLIDINNWDILKAICEEGYNKTGLKFSIRFEGSKGYLSHIEISCQGRNDDDNKIFVRGGLDNLPDYIMVNIFYSDVYGSRLSLADNAKPRNIRYNRERLTCKEAYESSFDLPF